MMKFIEQNAATIILCGIGLFFVIMTYGAYYVGTSGVPFVGGLFIAVGFLLSPWKWLALTALIDPGFWYPPVDMLYQRRMNRRFAAFKEEHGFAPGGWDNEYSLLVRVPAIHEELKWNYYTNNAYFYNIPKCVYAIANDASGARFLLVSRGRGRGEIEVLPFDEDIVRIENLPHRGKIMEIEIEVRKE